MAGINNDVPRRTSYTTSERQVWPTNTVESESFRDYFTPEDAAKSLGLSPQEFGALVKRFGIGRYHFPRQHDQIAYLRRDLDRAAAFLISDQGKRP
jgi:hypothetical protein